MRVNRYIRTMSFYFFSTVLALFSLIPFFWMISTSLKTQGALLVIPIEWIPKKISFEAYTQLFDLFPFGRAIWNSTFVTVGTTLITLFSAMLAAYVFAKVEFKGREVVFAIFLATMMVPGQVTTIPVFLILKELYLLNTFTGLLIPSIFNPFAVFMLRQHMMTIHNDYMDAAFMDGASHFRIFWKIVVPLSIPIIVTLAVLTIMGTWGDFFWPLVILQDKEKMTLTLALSQLNGQYHTRYNLLMAGSLISIVPIIVLYMFAQRYFKSGLQLGGLK